MSAISAEGVMSLTGVRLLLTPEQANELYNEITWLMRRRDVVSVQDRHLFDAPALYALYDGLNAAGIDGTGS